MFFDAELRFLQNVFRKARVQTMLFDPGEKMNPSMDLGLRALIQGKETYDYTFLDMVGTIKSNTIYKVQDSFCCNYIYMRLPIAKEDTVLFIGPYLSAPMSREQVLELAENQKVDSRLIRELEDYYGGVPGLAEDSHLFAALDTFAELIWGGGDRYEVIDFEQEFLAISAMGVGEPTPDNSDAAWNIQIIENTYAYENEIIKAVSQGQIHKTDILLSGFSSVSFKRRLTDPVRNLKNYCIIMNTLLRKAAESGGVHPVYLDRVSSDFAHRIELLTTTDSAQDFMSGMFRTYCRLVKKHSMRHYSPPVQKTITYIDFDLTSDLSLHTLAAMQNVSPSYFSSLFKQETGQTLTDYVNQKRVRHAAHLLSTTVLQVQTVAQHSGFSDMNYFSKVFKKYMGKTPTEYRKAMSV